MTRNESQKGREWRGSCSYPLSLSIKEKIGAIALEIYRADGVDFSEQVSHAR